MYVRGDYLSRGAADGDQRSLLFCGARRRFGRKAAQIYDDQADIESHDEDKSVFKGEVEYQVQFARELLQTTDVEYFILAHRHIPTRYELSPGHLFFNTGDWLENFSYLTFGTENPEPMLYTIS